MNDDTRLMQKRANLVMLLGLLAVSSGAILTKLLPNVHPLVIAAYRLGIAGIIVLPPGIYYGRKELSVLGLKNWLSLALAGFFLALHFGTWITSLSYTTVASSVILVNTSPIWVALMSPIILGESLQRREKLGIISSVIGAFIIGFGDISLEEKALWGDFLALVGALGLACYLIFGRKVREKLSLLPYIGVCYSFGAVCLWILVLSLALPVTGFGLKGWGILFAIAVVPQLLGHSCYNFALRYSSAVMVSVVLLGEPICASIMAWLLFGEIPQAAFFAGGILILFGIWLVGKTSKS